MLIRITKESATHTDRAVVRNALSWLLWSRFSFAPIVLQPTQEQDGSYEACEGGKCQRRVSIGPVMPVLHKKTYAGEGNPKPDPECGHDIA
jgi:hypothetical protein